MMKLVNRSMRCVRFINRSGVGAFLIIAHGILETLKT
jgi:hypothetical protein